MLDLADLDTNSELCQTGFWGAYKSHFGQTPRGFEIGTSTGSARVLVLERPAGMGLTLGYVPYGPQMDLPQRPAATLEDIARALRPHLSRRCAFIRFDVSWGTHLGPSLLWDLNRTSLRRPEVEIQPQSTVILDLVGSEGEILGRMHRKTRYNVGLSSRRGVEISEGAASDVQAWYEVKLENDSRDGIVTHSLAYYRGLFETRAAYGSGGPDVRLLLARVHDEVVGGIIVSLVPPDARYLHGASATRHRSTMFTYALQWSALKLARGAGCASYDLYGIPPSNDPTHPMHGLYRFKTGFGGRLLFRHGCYDAVFRPAAYAVMQRAERARYAYFKRIRRVFTRGSGSPAA